LANLEKYIEGLSEIGLRYDTETYKVLIPLYPPDPYREGLLWGTEMIYLPLHPLKMKCLCLDD